MQGRVCSSGTPRNRKESEQASSGQEPPLISFSFPGIYLRCSVSVCRLTCGNEDPRSQGLCPRSPGVGWGRGLSGWSWASPGVSSFLSSALWPLLTQRPSGRLGQNALRPTRKARGLLPVALRFKASVLSIHFLAACSSARWSQQVPGHSV